jgi:hypothetical protein
MSLGNVRYWHKADIQLSPGNVRFWGKSGHRDLTASCPLLTHSGRWMFGRIFGLDGRESYRELRLEPLCCPHRLSRGTAPHEREYPRR